MEDVTQVSLEQLEKDYKQAVGTYRYYDACDDLHNWNREKPGREANKQLLKNLRAEFKRRGVETPKVP